MISTVASLEQLALSDPDRIAVRCAQTSLSYAGLLEAARRRAEELAAAQVRTLALLADNSPEWIVTDLAAQLAGVVLVPLPAFFSASQLRHALADSGADRVVSDHGSRGLTRELSLVRLGSLSRRLELYRPTRSSPHARLPQATAKVSYTSGTTGEPKGVCLNQSGMDRVATSLREVADELGLRRHLCVLPLITLLENVAGVFAPLQNGGQICVPRLADLGWSGAARLDTSRLLGCIARFEPDSVILVPQLLHELVKALEHGACLNPCLRFVAVGGGHVSPTVLERAAAVGIPVYEGYGLTEAASVVALNSPTQRRRGSVGRPLAHASVRIDESGEILVSAASFCGFTGQAESLDTEIKTGDIGRLDEEGFLHVYGRRKHVFITSYGRNVSPEWIEAELTGRPSIVQAAVFGEARPWNVAVIVAAPGVTSAAIEADIEAANATLPDYPRVGHWIRATEAFSPANRLSTSNGRNRRDAIRERYRLQIDACYEAYVSQTALS